MSESDKRFKNRSQIELLEKNFEHVPSYSGSKYFVTFPYPYMNGKLHLGHLFTLSKAEFFSRYKLLLGFDVLFPIAFHCTGMPISASAQRLCGELGSLKEEDESVVQGPQGSVDENEKRAHNPQGSENNDGDASVQNPSGPVNKDDKAGAQNPRGSVNKVDACVRNPQGPENNEDPNMVQRHSCVNKERAQVQNPAAPKNKDNTCSLVTNLTDTSVASILMSFGFSHKDLFLFRDPNHWLSVFPVLCKKTLKSFHTCIDFSKSFITTGRNFYYDQFIKWQFTNLLGMDALSFGKRFTIYDPLTNQPCLDHDRATGEGVMPVGVDLFRRRICIKYKNETDHQSDCKLSNEITRSQFNSNSHTSEISNHNPSNSNCHTSEISNCNLSSESMLTPLADGVSDSPFNHFSVPLSVCFLTGHEKKFVVFKYKKEFFVVPKKAYKNLQHQCKNLIFKGELNLEKYEASAGCEEFLKQTSIVMDSKRVEMAIEDTMGHGSSIYNPKGHDEAHNDNELIECSNTKGHEASDLSDSDNESSKSSNSKGHDKANNDNELSESLNPKGHGSSHNNQAVGNCDQNSSIHPPQSVPLKSNSLNRPRNIKDGLLTDFFSLDNRCLKIFHNEKHLLDTAEPNDLELLTSTNLLRFFQPQSEVKSRSGAKCIVSLMDQWFINYNDSLLKKKATKCIDSMENLTRETKKDLLLGVDWIQKWGISRTFGLGTKIPFDERYVIDSLSDSTIYMLFYLIKDLLFYDLEGSEEIVPKKYVNHSFFEAIINGSEYFYEDAHDNPNEGMLLSSQNKNSDKPLTNENKDRLRPRPNLNENSGKPLTNEKKDRVRPRPNLNENSVKPLDNQNAGIFPVEDSREELQAVLRTIQEARNRIKHFYPVDLRVSGKDLTKNHLLFYIMNHCLLFPSTMWPKRIQTNGHLMLNNKKMSKSTGNFMTADECIQRFGVTSTRLTLAQAGDNNEDANFLEDVARGFTSKLTALIHSCEMFQKTFYEPEKSQNTQGTKTFNGHLNKNNEGSNNSNGQDSREHVKCDNEQDNNTHSNNAHIKCDNNEQDNYTHDNNKPINELINEHDNEHNDHTHNNHEQSGEGMRDLVCKMENKFKNLTLEEKAVIAKFKSLKKQQKPAKTFPKEKSIDEKLKFIRQQQEKINTKFMKNDFSQKTPVKKYFKKRHTLTYSEKYLKEAIKNNTNKCIDAYENMKFTEVIKYGFYEMINTRETYQTMTQKHSKNILKYWYSTLATLMYPIIPGFINGLSKKYKFIQKINLKKTKQTKFKHLREIEWMKKTIKNIKFKTKKKKNINKITLGISNEYSDLKVKLMECYGNLEKINKIIQGCEKHEQNRLRLFAMDYHNNKENYAEVEEEKVLQNHHEYLKTLFKCEIEIKHDIRGEPLNPHIEIL